MDQEQPGKPRNGSTEPEIAAAEWLLKEDDKPQTPAQTPDAAGPSGEVFDLADSSSSDWNLPHPVSVTPGVSRPKPATVSTPADPSALVPEIWSRVGEWGPNLLLLGGWGAFVAGVIYVAVGQEMYSLASLMLLVGLGVAAVLSYPILITLERPVRMTPEQAVRDYYAALSHHVPHFRRMWLLLAAAGRVSHSFGSFEGFKGYWTDRLATLKAGRAGALTPLVFEVVDFKSDKSAGKSEIDGEFTVRVYVRGKRAEGPIHTIPCRISFARGPDKMWYLENGMLPTPRPSHQA